jgi:hypothetical protein
MMMMMMILAVYCPGACFSNPPFPPPQMSRLAALPLLLCAAAVLLVPARGQDSVVDVGAFFAARPLVCGSAGGAVAGADLTLSPTASGVEFPAVAYPVNTDTFVSLRSLTVDLDGDRDPDVVHVVRRQRPGFSLLEWWQNVGGSGSSQFERHVVDLVGPLFEDSSPEVGAGTGTPPLSPPQPLDVPFSWAIVGDACAQVVTWVPGGARPLGAALTSRALQR